MIFRAAEILFLKIKDNSHEICQEQENMLENEISNFISMFLEVFISYMNIIWQCYQKKKKTISHTCIFEHVSGAINNWTCNIRIIPERYF